MSDFATAQANEPTQRSTQYAPAGNLCLLAWLEALILALLLQLPHPHLAGPQAARARRILLRRADAIAKAFAPDAPGHAAAVFLGLIPDWILPGHPRRGMRRFAIRHPYVRVPASARAPPRARPRHVPPKRKNTPQPEGALPRLMSLRYQNYSASRRRAAISPITPRRNAITHRMKITPCVTVTHAPNGAR
jgi:hypothetical protein